MARIHRSVPGAGHFGLITMKLTAKLFDIGTNEVLLNLEDAKNIGVLTSDRVQVLNDIQEYLLQHLSIPPPRSPPKGVSAYTSHTNQKSNSLMGTR